MIQSLRPTGRPPIRRQALAAMLVVCTMSPAAAQSPPVDLAEASLEALLDMEITSASKHEQRMQDTAAAAFVLTSEDIRRSGATTIADLLRIVPGLDVARIDGHRWAVAARGFNGLFSNKLLVLLDGRSVYNPFFSGVHWDVQDTALEDIERIEVIRGPGAALWGVNAVHGVINIITRPAGETQGTAATLTATSETRAIGTVRHGGRIGGASYRVFAKGSDVAASVTPQGETGPDGWRLSRAGLRLDASPRPADAVTLQADVYRGTVGDRNAVPLFAPPFSRTVDERIPVTGVSLLGQWTRRLAGGSTVSTRAYVDYYSRRPVSHRGEVAHTVDVEVQHHARLHPRHDLVYGTGARWVHLEGSAGDDEWFGIAAQRRLLGNTFVQDEVTLVPRRLRMTLGAKVEYGDESGANLQPSARLLWTPAARHTAWAAVARAVRTPNYSDRYMGALLSTFPLPEGGVGAVVLEASPDFAPERAIAVDVGYRVALSSRVSLDLAGYRYTHRSLGSLENTGWTFATDPVPHAVTTLQLANGTEGITRGVESVATWVVGPAWRLRGTYGWYQGSFSKRTGQLLPEELSVLQSSPAHQAHVQSWMTLPGRVELDLTLSRIGGRGGIVPASTRLDLRAAHRLTRRLELALVGENLLDAEHVEFVGELTAVTTTVARRSLGLRVGWSF
jgi:iron complex outermembrane receptor protein